jgi:hypothetical protein
VSGPQEIALPAAVTGRVFKLTIVEGIPGTKYPDLVLSELRLVTPEGAVTVRTPDRNDRAAALRAEAKGKGLGAVMDRNRASFCDGENSGRALKLRSNHTFVWYDEHVASKSDDSRESQASVQEVFDGTWVPTRQTSASVPWSEISLYGRIHRMESAYSSYSQVQASDVVRIGGGKVEIARVSDLGEEGLSRVLDEWRKGPARDRVSCIREVKEAYEHLAANEGIVVRGPAMTDVLWKAP